ncbi:C39 family peptidase [Candidatus Microgenomates bacterium]|nr:C39 family peptidase [Candidatus Microgenomates bacterium]
MELKTNITFDDIISALEQNSLVIVPMDGQALHNPHFTGSGPARHMILIIGYDPKTKEITTNDPGFTVGKSYRYPADLFYLAIRDYPTGNHVPITKILKNGIIVHRLS